MPVLLAQISVLAKHPGCFGAFKRKTEDYSIPGRADNTDPDSEKNVVRNRAVYQQGGSIGGSFVGELGYFGGSITRLESKYGIPGSDGASIDLKTSPLQSGGRIGSSGFWP